MGSHIWSGSLLVMLGGVMMGNTMLPLKYLRHWRWENAWLVFSVVGLLLIPWTLAFIWVPSVWMVYSHVSYQRLAVPFLYGAGWGIANVLFGLSVVRIGMALAFAVTIGLSAALGTLIPLALQHRQSLAGKSGFWIIGGVLIMLAGVAACSWAGRQRELARAAVPDKGDPNHFGGSFRVGLFLAIAGGLLAPMMNYALAFGGDIIGEAVQRGAAPANAPYAVWPIALGGGLIANGSYSLYLLARNRTLCRFLIRRWDIVPSAFMGILFMGAVSVYGIGTAYLGPLGPSSGWAIFQILVIISSSISGIFTGEWSGAAKKTIYALSAGLLLLALAIGMIASGNR